MKIDKLTVVGQKCYGFNMYREMVNSDVVIADEPEIIDSFNPDMNKSLFDIVFSVNPLTGLPVGDVAMFMNENTSPDIRRFIELNLHSPVNIDGDASGDLAGLSDDDIVTYMREPGESLSDYRSRMVTIVRENLKSKVE